MHKLLLVGLLSLVGFLGASFLAPGGDWDFPFPSIPVASAAISRGGGEGAGAGGGGSALQVAPRAFSILTSAFKAGLFVLTAGAIGVAAMKRDMGLAVLAVVLSLVVGAFVLAPQQVEAWFISIYQFVL